MPAVRRKHVENLADQARHVDLLESGDHGGAEEDLDPFVVEYADRVAQRCGEVQSEALGVTRLQEPCGESGRQIELRNLASTCSVLRKFAQMKDARFSPIRFLLLGMIAVCGMGNPSGWRNSATTANQSAIAPTIAASANAATYPHAE